MRRRVRRKLCVQRKLVSVDVAARRVTHDAALSHGSCHAGVSEKRRRLSQRGLESQRKVHHSAASPLGFSDCVTPRADDERGRDVIRDEK